MEIYSILNKLGSSVRTAFRRGLVGLLAAASLAGAVSGPAESRGGWDPGAAAAVGVIGGLALGAALSHPAPSYGVPVYDAADDPYWRYHHHHYGWAPPPADCYVVRQRVWIPGWGWDTRPRTVCE
jgi:hypothetical protein